jgi:hypothetical protein
MCSRKRSYDCLGATTTQKLPVRNPPHDGRINLVCRVSKAAVHVASDGRSLSDLGSLSQEERVLHVDAKIAQCALDHGVIKQIFDGADQWRRGASRLTPTGGIALRRHRVAAIMTAIVSSGMSHIGKWPLDSNQCRSAEGKAAFARAACLGRHKRSCRPHPITMRPVASAAGPVCSRPLARSWTSASNVDVVLRLANSVATTCGSSAQGCADNCASSAVRDAAFPLSIGRLGRIARSNRPETPMVILKKVRSQLRQKPPGSSATTLPILPRRASSSTIRAPIELPTTSIPASPLSAI